MEQSTTFYHKIITTDKFLNYIRGVILINMNIKKEISFYY